MAMKNKHAKRSRTSEAKIRGVVRCFAADLTALQAAALSGLNRHTVNRLYRGLRERIVLGCETQRPLFGVVEVDESLFGARCLRQNSRLRHLRAPGASLHRDRLGLLEADVTGHYPGPGGRQHRHPFRWLAWLQRPSRSRLWSLPRRSLQGGVHQGGRPYQRHLGLVGSGEGQAGKVQRPAQTHLAPPSQGNRMAIQPSRFQQVSNPATVPMRKPTQLGMTQI